MSTNSFFKIKSMNRYSQNIKNNNEHSANNGANETVKLRTTTDVSKEARETQHTRTTDRSSPIVCNQRRSASTAIMAMMTTANTTNNGTYTHKHTCHSMLHCTLATRSRHVQTRQALCSWSSATDSARWAPHAPLSTLLCPFPDQIQPIRHYTHTQPTKQKPHQSN